MTRKDFPFLGILLLLSICTHWVWFLPSSILSSGDWFYWHQSLVNNLFTSWSTWLTHQNLGVPNIQIYFFVFTSLWASLGLMGIDFDIAFKLTILLPIAIGGFFAPYLYVRSITNSQWVAFFVAIFWASTTYFLMKQTSHMLIAFVYAFTPLLIFIFDKAIQSRKINKWWMYFVLLYVLLCGFEIRIVFIVSILLFGYFIVRKAHPVFSYAKIFFLIFCLLLSLNLFWLLPTIIGGLSGAVSDMAKRGLFGNHLFSMQSALTIMDFGWTGGHPETDFVLHSTPWHLYITPFLSILALLLIKDKSSRRLLLYFTALYMIGVLLTKQSAYPFAQLYKYVYENVPGFSLYRESSKFFLVSSLGSMGLIMLLLNYLKKNCKSLFIIACSSLTVMAILNFKPLVNRDIGTMFVNRELHKDYLFPMRIEKAETQRILWVPRNSRWSYHDDSLPRLSLSSIGTKEWRKIIEKNFPERKGNNAENAILLMSDEKIGEQLIAVSNVQFVVVPIEDKTNEDNVFQYYSPSNNVEDIRNWYIKKLDSLSYLERIDIDTKELIVYKSKNRPPYIRSISSVTSYRSLENLDEKYTFSSSVLKEDFDFVEHREPLPFPVRGVRHVFENITSENISERGITETFETIPGNASLYARTPAENVSVNNSSVSLSPAERSQDFARFPIETSADSITITYRDPEKPLENRIPNPSFEDGLWKEKVGDCNNFDKNGLLDMKRSDEASDGSHSLELHATRHIACTNQKFLVSGGRTYLFSFDYQSPNGKQAGFYIGFDGPNKSAVSEKIPFKKSPSSSTLDFGLSTLQTAPDELPWFSFTKQITIPDGSTTASLTVYSYSTDNETDIVTRYDNFSFIELPDIADRYYLVSDPETNFVEPKEITFDLINPTKKLVHIKGATTPFYLAMSESYHPQWQAQFSNEKINGFFRSWIPWVKPDAISNDHHFELNGFLNGWYVDPSALCAEVPRTESQVPSTANTEERGTQNSELRSGCTLNADGSYDIELTLEFFPQRWFYLGLLISGTTLLACLGYLGYDFFRRRKNKQ